MLRHGVSLVIISSIILTIFSITPGTSCQCGDGETLDHEIQNKYKWSSGATRIVCAATSIAVTGLLAHEAGLLERLSTFGYVSPYVDRGYYPCQFDSASPWPGECFRTSMGAYGCEHYGEYGFTPDYGMFCVENIVAAFSNPSTSWICDPIGASCSVEITAEDSGSIYTNLNKKFNDVKWITVGLATVKGLSTYLDPVMWVRRWNPVKMSWPTRFRSVAALYSVITAYEAAITGGESAGSLAISGAVASGLGVGLTVMQMMGFDAFSEIKTYLKKKCSRPKSKTVYMAETEVVTNPIDMTEK